MVSVPTPLPLCMTPDDLQADIDARVLLSNDLDSITHTCIDLPFWTCVPTGCVTDKRADMVCRGVQQRRKDAAAKAEDLAEQQRLRLLEKERVAEANRIQVRAFIPPPGPFSTSAVVRGNVSRCKAAVMPQPRA